MGGDGGSVARRSELVSHNKGYNNSSKDEFGVRCALSDELLVDPVVSDWRGRAYNKTAVLELLLGVSRFVPPDDAQIASLRDVVELERLVIEGVWVCALTKRPVSAQRTVYIPECGHVGAERVFKERGALHACPLCETSYTHLVLLNAQAPSDLSHAAMRLEHLHEQGLTHSLRPARVAKRRQKRRPSQPGSQDSSLPEAKKSRHHMDIGEADSENRIS